MIALAIGEEDPIFSADIDVILRHELLEDFFGDGGAELPRFGFAVFLSNTAIKFSRQAANDEFVADVGFAQTAGGHSTEMPAGFDEDDGFAGLVRCDSGDNTAGRAAVDADIPRCDFLTTQNTAVKQ